MELWNAGLDNPSFLSTRIEFCEEMLRRFGNDGDDLRNENSRRALGGCYSRLGQFDTVDALYQEWLQRDPRWGWGWIGWADCYSFGPDSKDATKAEQLLRQGLSIAEVRGRNDILERLSDNLEDLGRNGEADEIRSQIDHQIKPWGDGNGGAFADVLKVLSHTKATTAVATPNTNVTSKSDRLRRCHCGSGKKFRKCCGK